MIGKDMIIDVVCAVVRAKVALYTPMTVTLKSQLWGWKSCNDANIHI